MWHWPSTKNSKGLKSNQYLYFYLKISNQSLNLTYVFICWANSSTFKLFNVYWTLVNKMINQSIVTEHNPGHFLQIGVAVACYVLYVIDKAWNDQTLPFLQLRAFVDLQHKKKKKLTIHFFVYVEHKQKINRQFFYFFFINWMTNVE